MIKIFQFNKNLKFGKRRHHNRVWKMNVTRVHLAELLQLEVTSEPVIGNDKSRTRLLLAPNTCINSRIG